MTQNIKLNGLTIVVITGFVSLIIGSWELAGTFEFFMDQKDLGHDYSVSGWSLGKAGLILCELLITSAFSIVGLLMIGLKGIIKKPRNHLIFLGTIRMVLLILMLSIFWKPGWYYILDPNGSYKLSFILIFLSGVQALSFIYSINWKTNNLENERIH